MEVDPPGPGQLDQVGRLVRAQVARRHELEPDGGRGHALLEVGAREAVAVVEELDHESSPETYSNSECSVEDSGCSIGGHGSGPDPAGTRAGGVRAGRACNALLTRRKGLLGRSGLADDEGLWIPTSSIHMFGMRFAIDVVYADREGRVLKLVAGSGRGGRRCAGGQGGARAAGGRDRP